MTDLLKIKTVGDIHLDKDGRRAVFTLTTIEPDTSAKTSKWEFKYVTQLYLIASDGLTPPRQLTTAKEGASQPALSPDGRQLAFVRATEGKPQIFLLPLDGGEPTQLTHFRYGAASPKWSPDGKEILFSARITLPQLIGDSSLNPHHDIPAWPDEKPGIAGDADLHPSTAKPDPDGNMDQVRAWLAGDVTDKKAKVVDKLNFQDEMEVNPETSFTHWFTQSLQPESPPAEVTHGFYSYNSADYSPDGKTLYFTAHIDSTEDPDRALESEIWFADRDGAHLHKVLGEKGKVFNSPRFSPDGTWMAYQVSPISFVSVPQLYIQNPHRCECPRDRYPLRPRRRKPQLERRQPLSLFHRAVQWRGAPLSRSTRNKDRRTTLRLQHRHDRLRAAEWPSPFRTHTTLRSFRTLQRRRLRTKSADHHRL